MEDVIVGLDIGTTKTCAVIGFMGESGTAEVAGVGIAPSRGLKNGVIVNIDSTISSIIKAVEDAELMAGTEIGNVLVSITGQHLKGENSKGVVAVSNRNRTITHSEIRRVIEAAQAVVIPADREILHVLSKEFTVDDQIGIKDPVGMSGVRLEAEVHIITGSASSINNLSKALVGAGLQCSDILFSPLASAEAVLSADEKELGVALVDIGGGTTDIVIYLDGGVTYSSVLSIGGIHVTNDISIGLRTPQDSAEVIKKKYGCAVLDLVDASETIEVPSVGDRAPRRQYRQELTQIIEPRMIEMMEMIDHELLKSGKKDLLAAGVVITGGGSMLDGTVEAAERVFNLPVRTGLCRDITGLKDVVASPQYSNAVGLLKYGVRAGRFNTKIKARKNNFSSFGQSLKRWIEEYL
ncbi:MAG: cell division protein FtsA [Spirochaetes bacterium]|nr:cell division protein FtsA [Spirochaetota bacterium]